MSSRKEEKEARRLEREAQQAESERAAANKRRLQLVGGVVVAILAVGGVSAAVLAGGGGDDGPKPDGATDLPKASIPAQRITDLAQAAKAANCEVKEQLPNEGNDHVEGTVSSYKTNPPTSGPHNITPAQEGEYSVGNEPAKENWVHALEHGRIIFQFAPGTSTADQAKLSALFGEDFSGSNGYHQLLFQNDTKMPYKFAAVAWTNYVGCPGPLNSETIDTFRAFRAKYVDKGPELIP